MHYSNEFIDNPILFDLKIDINYTNDKKNDDYYANEHYQYQEIDIDETNNPNKQLILYSQNYRFLYSEFKILTIYKFYLAYHISFIISFLLISFFYY